MDYRKRLTVGWARRDTLAVIVITVTVAFLVGAAILGIALGTQTTDIAAQFEPTYAVTENPEADTEAVPLVLAETVIGERTYTVVGLPEESQSLELRDQTVTLPAPEPEVLASAEVTPQLRSRAELPINSRPPHPLFSDRWLVTDVQTAQSFSEVQTIGLDPSPSPNAAPLVGALQFFIEGSEELVGVLRVSALAAAVLVTITVYSVIQITIRERRQDIGVLRATGASPRVIVAIFAGRALLMTALGTALGYAIGLILVRSVINAATFLGVTTTLGARITPSAVELLAPAFAAFLIVGMLAGALAGWRTVRVDPGNLAQNGKESRFVSLNTTFIDWRTLVPATATLTVFMCFFFVLAGVVGAVGPLANTGQQTITEPGTPNPVASDVPVSYARALQNQGAAVSPEIILFELHAGNAILTRGVNFTAYREFTGLKLDEGQFPGEEHEALIGNDLAQSSEIAVGDTLVLGGSTTPAVSRVDITGRYEGKGIEDDQLLVSLSTARTLTNVQSDAVNLVRTRGLPTTEATQSTIIVTDAAPARSDGTRGVQLTFRNPGFQDATRSLTVELGEQTQTIAVSVPSQQSRESFIGFERVKRTQPRLRAGSFETKLRFGASQFDGVETSDGTRLSVSVPETVPVGSEPVVRITQSGEPQPNAIIRYGNGSVETNDEGVARVPFGRIGNVTLSVQANGTQIQQRVQVRENESRPVGITASVDPTQPSIFTRPTAMITLSNRWAFERNETVRVTAPGVDRQQSVRLAPGGEEQLTVQLPQRPAGEYRVTAEVNKQSENVTYRVQGDERLGAALAQSGRYTAGGGITQAIQVVFSNIEVLIAAIIFLLVIMTLGSSTAAFTRAIQTTKQEIGIYRATGASPISIILQVAGDAMKLGVVATSGGILLAMVFIEALLSLGALRAFGIVLSPQYTVSTIVIAGSAGLALAVVSAVVASSVLVRGPPANLFKTRTNTRTEESR